MNIGIATIYKCYNFGSFFQAFALQEYLKSLGHKSFFLETDCAFNRLQRRHRMLSRAYPLRKNCFSLKSAWAYRKDWRLLNVADKSQHVDCIIAGSDEIWNIRNRSFVADERYYGQTAPVSCFAYAPCIGSASFQDFSSSPNLLGALRTMTHWSARDEATEHFLKQVEPNKQVTRVLDPSFLVDWKKYERHVPSLGEFILVYTYDGIWGFTDEMIQQVKHLAQKTGLPLYSFGFLNEWCDRSISCSPLEFLGYLRQASYVVTDTFHGTVMSLQYHKHLACMDPKKQKIASMASMLGIDMNQLSLDNIKNKISYMKIGETIDQLRHQSIAFLENALADVVGKVLA